MKTGITHFILPELSPIEFMKAAANAGYDSVELSLAGKGELTLHSTPEQLQGIRETAKTLGLEISSMGHYRSGGNLLDSGKVQAQGIADTKAGLHIAKTLGMTCTLHTLGNLSADLYYEDAWNNAVTSLKELAVTCEETGVDIAIEFVWNGFLFSPLEMRRLFEEVGSDRIGFYFDPGNMAVFHYPQHWVRALGKHTKRVHVKDWQGKALKGGWTPLLQGEVDYPAVMRELRAIGFDGALTSEVSTDLASLEETAQAIEEIKTM